MQFHRKNLKTLGNTFLTSLLFLFILASTLRVCSNKTFQECKLTNIFVQETQSYYLLENLMALSRDYAHQLTQNPMMANLFLSVDAYRDKDVSSNKTGTIIDFNDSFSKDQIVPNDFPLQISSWDVKGGPIFWQDKRKDTNDERYLSEVFLLGELGIVSNLIPNWKAHIVQTMEIERNPLCDFQLYSEGDTVLNGNIGVNDYLNFYGPIQINGNTRFPFYTDQTSSGYSFYKKVNLAGHALRICEQKSSVQSIAIPEKYCFYDNHLFYDTFQNPYIKGDNDFKIFDNNSNALKKISDFSNNAIAGNFYNYEQYAFENFEGKFITRSRVYRPYGFDPISDWGYWFPVEGGGSSESARVLDMCLGFHNICKASANHNLFSTRAGNAVSALRGLNNYQMAEKIRLVEMQKAMNAPGLEVKLALKSQNEVNTDSLRVAVNFPYVTYNTSHFPATKDNLYLNRYLSLKFQENSIFSIVSICENIEGATFDYALSSSTNLSDVLNKKYYNGFSNGKMVRKEIVVGSTYTLDRLSDIFIEKKGFDLVEYSDPNSPPHKLVDCEDYWTLDACMARLCTTPGYQYLYDRNRAKWIQLLDIDVGKLKTAVSNRTLLNWEKLGCTIKINADWQGHTNNANRNYKDYTYVEDIRLNYNDKRNKFFLNSKYNEGNFVYSNVYPPVVDIGIRIINAETLPDGGLTIVSPFPVYLKGSFNVNSTKPKACIIADSLTLLSDDWQDWRSGMDFGNSYLYSSDGKSKDPNISPITIYAHVITGRTHPNYWIKDTNTFPDFGIHDAFRTLEDFSAAIKFYGSLLLPYYCQQQWEPPIDFCHSVRLSQWYAYLNLNLGSDGIEWKKMRSVSCMPTYLKINRGRKTQPIGTIVYNALLDDVRGHKTDAKNYTFSDYHSALPDFLKYPKDP